MPVLFVSDLDGTLLDDEQCVSATTVKLINELVADGLWFTVATARSSASALPLLAGLDLRLPMVFHNGVFVSDPATGATLATNFLGAPVARYLVSYYLALGLGPFVNTIDDHGRPHVWYPGIRNVGEEIYVAGRRTAGDDRFQLVNSFDDALTENVISVNAIDVPANLASAARELRASADVFAHFGPDIYVPGFSWLEVSHPRANKGDAARFIKEHLGARRLVCFGDNANDLEMFQIADESYAVANAHADLIRAATRVIGTNSAHAVAYFLRDTVPLAG